MQQNGPDFFRKLFVQQLKWQLDQRTDYKPAPDFFPTACSNQRNQVTQASFDFIVVGAGAGGSVVARKLSDNPSWKVLLIEAGDEQQTESAVPEFFPFGLNNTNCFHQFANRDPLSSNAFKFGTNLVHGKQLGGSTGTNAMYYRRKKKLELRDKHSVANFSNSLVSHLLVFLLAS